MIRSVKSIAFRKTPSLVKANTRHADAMTPYFESLIAMLANNDTGGFSVPESIGVTSTNHGEGVSTIAFALAANATNFIQDQITLVLTTPVSEEFRRRYGFEAKPGIADVLSGSAQTSECMQEILGGRVRVLSSGLEANSNSSLDPVRTAHLVQQISEDSRLMIVDLPPVSKGGVCLTTAGRLSGVIFTVEANRVAAAEIANAQSRLVSVGVNVFGAVLNKKA